MTALSATHNVASIARDNFHEANVNHEWVGSIAYDTCISTNHIPLLSVGVTMSRLFQEFNWQF